MDLYERLSRMFMRRKYARVEDRGRPPLLTKSKSMKVPRAEKKLERSNRSALNVSEPPAVTVPKRFTLRSTNNEVIDGAWFNSALRRSVAEGRLNLANIAD